MHCLEHDFDVPRALSGRNKTEPQGQSHLRKTKRYSLLNK